MIENLRNGTFWISIDDWYVFLYSVYVFSWDPECL